MLARLHTLVTRGTAPDLMICNYVYEHTEDGTRHTVRYTNIFPQERLFTWMHVGHFRPDQNLLMHSVMYRTEVLRKCGMVLPKHTFYVDNIFVYQPLPFVKTMYYMDLDSTATSSAAPTRASTRASWSSAWTSSSGSPGT